MSIDLLEARIAPAATFVSPTTAFYTDVDGDKITVVFSKAILNSGNVANVLVTSAEGLGDQLRTIDLTGSLAVAPDGTNITITAVPQDLTPMDTVKIKSGDGLANVGYINATGHPLGTVKVPGDLGVIDAGSTAINAVAIQAFTVQSMGELALTTGAPDVHSDIKGSVKSFIVKGNVRGAFVEISGSTGTMPNVVESSLGALTVGGSVIGGSTQGSGTISATGHLGPVKVGGSLVGGSALATGQIGSVNGSMGAVTIGGDVVGGPKGFSGYLFAKTTIGAVSIGGSLLGGGNTASDSRAGAINTNTGNITSVKITGSLIGLAGGLSGSITASSDMNTTGSLGPVTIGGDVVGGTNASAGRSGFIQAAGNIGAVTIGGSLLGGANSFSGSILAGANLGLVKIGGSLRGGAGNDSGHIGGVVMAGVTVNGSIIGGDGMRTAQVAAATKLTFAKVGGNLEGGGTDSSQITSAHDLGTVTIGGSLIGFGEQTATIGLKDAGDERQTVGAITIGGSIIGGVGQNSGMIRSFSPDVHDFFSTIKVAGDLRGAGNNMTGSVIVGNATSITFGGSLLAGTGTLTAYISGLAVGTVSIAGDVRGTNLGAGTLVNNGYLEFTTCTSLTIGGSLVVGSGNGGMATPKSGLYASESFGSITIKGSLIGQATNPATIYAGGRPGDPVLNNIGIKSLTILGNVENAWIFAGVAENGAAGASNVQIGTVKVTGDWIASSLGSSVTSTNGIIGDGNDSNIGLGTAGKIASIVISGQVFGRAGTAETFGFFAHEIGSFKSNGIALALRPGKANDAFTYGLPGINAFPVGSSLSPSTNLKPDAFAVHVYEV